MREIKTLQAEIVANKKAKGFNTTNLEREFLLLYGEINEAYESFLKHDGQLGEELADVAIYLLGLAELTGVDLGKEIERKIAINRKRQYEKRHDFMSRLSDEADH